MFLVRWLTGSGEPTEARASTEPRYVRHDPPRSDLDCDVGDHFLWNDALGRACRSSGFMLDRPPMRPTEEAAKMVKRTAAALHARWPPRAKREVATNDLDVVCDLYTLDPVDVLWRVARWAQLDAVGRRGPDELVADSPRAERVEARLRFARALLEQHHNPMEGTKAAIDRALNQPGKVVVVMDTTRPGVVFAFRDGNVASGEPPVDQAWRTPLDAARHLMGAESELAEK